MTWTKYQCELCGFKGYKSQLLGHVEKVHNISMAKYAWKYIWHEDGEPVCKTCGKPLQISRLDRYSYYCNQTCWYNSEELKENSSELLTKLHKDSEFQEMCNKLSSERFKKLWASGVFKNKWKELSEGSHDPDFMYAKLASRVDVDKPCTFYFVKDSKCIKVGFTFNFDNRGKNLPKTIVKLVEFNNSYNCIKSECEFHNYFKDKCIMINGKISEYYPIELESDLLIKFDELVSKYNI